MKGRLACAIGTLVFCAALARRPAFADSLEDCKNRVEALQNRQANDPDLTIETCTSFLKTAKGNEALQGHYYLAMAHFQKPDYYHAIKELDTVIDGSRMQMAYFNRGLAYMGEMEDDPAFADSAISDLNEAANRGTLDNEKKALFWPAYLTRAITNLKKGEDENAQSDEDAAISLNPEKAVAIKADFGQAYAQRALQSLASGQYDRAATDLQHAIQLDPQSTDRLTPYLKEAQSRQPGPYSAIARGEQHAEGQDYEQALKDYSEAIQANSHLAVAYLERGSVYRAVNRFEDALADFAQAIRLDQNDWAGYYDRGQLYLSVDQFDQAATDFNQASAIIDRVHDWAYDYKKERLENAQKSLQFNRTIQGRWVSYLKEIQAANTYSNWSAPPYDLYVRHHGSPTDAALESPGSGQSSAPKDHLQQPRRPILVVVMLGIVVVVLFSTVILFFRK